MNKEGQITDDGFKIVLEDHCLNEGKSIDIITSISGLVYRVEIKEDQVLIDAMEIPCDSLDKFQSLYTAKHNEMLLHYSLELKRDHPEVFASKAQEVLSQESPYTVFTPAKTTEPKRKSFFSFEFNAKIILALMTLLLVFIITIMFFLCQPSVYNQFLSTKEEKIWYLSKIEPYCHHLEEGCRRLASKEDKPNDIYTRKNCQSWCQNEIIEEESCQYFLNLSKKHSNSSARNLKNVPLVSKQNTTRYTFSPKKIVFQKFNTFSLEVRNHEDKALYIELRKINLEGSNYEEIVQLRNRVFSFSLAPNERKKFQFFLEPTYYKQFDSGSYMGDLNFLLSYDGEEDISIEKAFSFEVE